MLNNILSMEGVAVLDKKQQMSINGGSCAYYNGETGDVSYHQTSQGAQDLLQNASDHWCCSTCDTASWYQPCTPHTSQGPSGKWVSRGCGHAL
ncbi:MAG: hypothetical protein AB8F74_03620 [Saprospiraceae bacterium]